jgi:hypothetical protein
LDEFFNYIQEKEIRLVLEIDGYKIGFLRDNNITTHLLPYSNVGSGSDFNSCIRINQGYDSDDPSYVVSEYFIKDENDKKAYYLKDNNQIYKKNYYRIKPFNNANNNESNENNSIDKLYNDASYFLKNNNNIDSIDKSILYQRGNLKQTFYSSTLELNSSFRSIIANKSINDRLSNIAYNLDPNFEFEILVNDDRVIQINTGMYSNFELLNEITKNSTISWREIGLVDTSNGIKTKIQIGNFDNLPAKFIATNRKNNDIFENNIISIQDVANYFPTLSIDLNVNNFILEGENIKIIYKESLKTINNEIKIFNIDKIQNYKGGTINLNTFL